MEKKQVSPVLCQNYEQAENNFIKCQWWTELLPKEVEEICEVCEVCIQGLWGLGEKFLLAVVDEMKLPHLRNPFLVFGQYP